MEPMSLGPLAVWRHPVENPTARVLHIHGICEHSGRHMATVQALNAVGVEVVRFDLRGSGMSGGRRQYVEYWDDYVQDAVRVYNWISSELPPLPLFVMGHSMGGAIGMYFASEYGKFLQGLVLSAPGYRIGKAVPPLKVKVGRVLSKFVPTMRFAAGSPGFLSRDKAVVEAYLHDPLAHRFNTLRQGEVVLDAFEVLPEKCRMIHVPTLILHGSADKLILPAGSFELLQSLASNERELHYLPGVFHEPHVDWDAEKFFSILCRWVTQRAPAVAADRGKSKKQAVSQAYTP